tara:strand:+ start:405 stop:836 length:432 start_codon:yes stop_codon:yes gene_type:complete
MTIQRKTIGAPMKDDEQKNYEYYESLYNPDLLSGLTMEGMIALRTRINQAITLEKRNIKDRLKQQFAEEAWRNGLTIPEIFGIEAHDLRRKNGLRGKKVPPKYTSPNSTGTWTGRGRRPLWLVAHVNAGGTVEECLIETAQAA